MNTNETNYQRTKKLIYIIAILALGALVLQLSSAKPVSAATVGIDVLITADNAYELCWGDVNTVNGCVGGNNVLSTVVNHTLFPLDSQTGYIYIAAWSDHATAQGLVARLTSTNGTVLLTGNSAFEVYATNALTSTPPITPTAAQMTGHVVSANFNMDWVSPAIGPLNGSFPWTTQAAAIGSASRWIWFDSTGNGNTFTPGFNHNEYLIFRIPVSSFFPQDAYQYTVKFVCGTVQDGDDLMHTPVVPGTYATEINIFDPRQHWQDEEIEVTKRFIPLVSEGEAIGREPEYSQIAAYDSINLLPETATMDDCQRINELLYSGAFLDLDTMRLTIGFMEILSPVELKVDAVYTARDPNRQNITMDVERIEGDLIELIYP